LEHVLRRKFLDPYDELAAKRAKSFREPLERLRGERLDLIESRCFEAG
jgi:hypothetical protein